jgi:diguanylate cyclase (GGDEF)-like protein
MNDTQQLSFGQVKLLDALFRMRSLIQIGLGVSILLIQGDGEHRTLVALLILGVVVPINEVFRRLITTRWQRLPLAIPWIDLISALSMLVIEPTMWIAVLLAVTMNFSLPFAVHSQRAVSPMVAVAVSALILTSDQAQLDPIGAVVTFVLTIPMLYSIVSRLGGRYRSETKRRNHLLDGLDAVAWEFNLTTASFTFVSERAERRFGTPLSAWLSDPTAWLARVHPDDRAQVATADALQVAAPGTVELRVVDDDAIEWWRLTLSQGTSESGAPLIHGVMVDISDLRRAQAALTLQAETDPLTGLPNRVALTADLERRFALQDRPFGLLLIDLDDFKHVNDSLGHVAGDALLVEVAARLRLLAGENDLMIRLGGDEFACVVTDDDIRAKATTTAQAIADALAQPIRVTGAELRIHASVGIAVWPDDADDPISLLRRADLTMYVAKRGRLGSAHFETRHDESNLRTTRLMVDLPAALASGQIHVHLQPRVRLSDGVIVGAEALARWAHPELGEIGPVEFLPVVEMTGSGSTFTRHILHQTALVAQRWHSLGRDLDVAVNVTAADLLSASLLDTVKGLPAATGFGLNRLILEVTETQVMDHVDLVQLTLDRLKALGVRMSLDDFGTGHSSFARLRDLHMSELKIDQSFVTGLGMRTADEPILRSIIELARNLGLTTVAEGVEDESTLTRLREFGCDQAQGFHLGRPMTPGRFEHLLLHSQLDSQITNAELTDSQGSDSRILNPPVSAAS